MSDLLKSYSYEANKYVPFSGTEDWVEVARLGTGGYSWSELNAFYSPSARRYFWASGSGCSCNSWGDGITSAADFENGDRAALLRAWEIFAKENDYEISTSDYTDGVTEINAFKATP